MTGEMIFTFIVVLIMLIGLIKEIARPDVIVFTALSVFFITGILTAEEAFAGFANQGMLTVALLFIVAGAIQKSGLVEQIIFSLLKKGKSDNRTLFTFLLPITAASAFLNNTPIVMTLTPIVRKWCVDHNIAPSKFLIPLSYATILGGMLTLMGTSTNLVVHGLMVERGMEGYSMFTLAKYSLPASVIGLIYLVTFGYKILPSYEVSEPTVTEKSREYLIEMVIEENYPYLDNPLVNKTVEESGLRDFKGVYLIAVIRNNEKIYPVRNSTKIWANDRLIFTGVISRIAEIQSKKGIELKTGTNVTLEKLRNGNTQVMEVVISHQSSLLHKKIKENKFRAKYDADVIAVHRNNERIESGIGDITLKAGDTLLLLAGADFEERFAQSNDFYVAMPLNKHPLLHKIDKKNAWLSILILASMIFLVSFGILSMLKAMTVTVILYIVLKVITPEDISRDMQYHVLLLIASAFGVGQALFKTGAADWIANKLILVSEPFGLLGILILLYIVTVSFTEMITNNGAAVLMFPIAIEAANKLAADPMAFLIIITIGASASFLSPIGYQTNLIVYGPGGYKFTDYFKVGLPLNLIVLVTTIGMIYIF